MIREISQLQDLFFTPLEIVISNIQQDLECEEYLGYNFNFNKLKIKFRKAKITPKKVGQFVTLWKRTSSGVTEPFNENDDFDFYIVASEFKEESGFFFFSKNILIQKHILSSSEKEGKRGFRVYPDWDVPTNKQAGVTKNWQSAYFFNFKTADVWKFKNILNQIH